MSFVIIFYLAILMFLISGFIYRGINLLRNGINDLRSGKIRQVLKASENDEIDFNRFNKYDAGLSIIAGLLYLVIFLITFRFVSDLTGTPAVRDIHLIRTCIIGMIVIYLSRVLCLERGGEKYIRRNSNTGKPGYNFKTAVVFLVLLITLIYSIYIQITYAW